MKECVRACVCVPVCGGDLKTAVQSLCLFIRWRRRGGGKIYLQPSENFDPRVVNLSKESSQLNRKHEEERKGGVGVGRLESLVCFGVGGHTHSKEALFRVWGLSRHVYNPETDPSQLANLPPALPSPHHFSKSPKIKDFKKCNKINSHKLCRKCLFENMNVSSVC